MIFATLLAALAVPGAGQAVLLKTASRHPMEYYVSLPEGWSVGKKWPVVFVIESAERDFRGTADLFAKARKKRPFIIVVPLVVTNGGPSYRSIPSYHYSDSTWGQVAQLGEYPFDLGGIEAVASDVQRSFSGESKFFMTGFEAGCHTLFAVTFRHPEWLFASAPIAPNFQGRGLSAGDYSKSPSRKALPIHELHGSVDPFCDPGKPFFAQWQAAKSVASEHGFGNVTEQVVPGKGHAWLAGEVLDYFDSIARSSSNR